MAIFPLAAVSRVATAAYCPNRLFFWKRDTPEDALFTGWGLNLADIRCRVEAVFWNKHTVFALLGFMPCGLCQVQGTVPGIFIIKENRKP